MSEVGYIAHRQKVLHTPAVKIREDLHFRMKKTNFKIWTWDSWLMMS